MVVVEIVPFFPFPHEWHISCSPWCPKRYLFETAGFSSPVPGFNGRRQACLSLRLLNGGTGMKKTGVLFSFLAAVVAVLSVCAGGAEAVLKDLGPLNFGGYPSY